MRLSICVCTYNRAHILPYCLDSLKNLEVPSGCELEILVIDNNSRDNTKNVVYRSAQQSSIPILYYHESQQSLSAARNRAIKEARGDYMGFLDDECVVSANWLQVMADDTLEFRPLIIGGPYVGALLPGSASKWFKPEYGNAYFLTFGFKRLPEELSRVRRKYVPSSAGMRGRAIQCGTRMKGNEMRLGEEILVQNQFLSDNVQIMVFYEPSIEVAHFVVPQKMSLAYRARREMEAGAYDCQRKSLSALAVEIGRALTFLCLSPLRILLRNRRAYPHWQNYTYERIIPRVMPVVGAAGEKVRRRCR